MAKSDLFNDYYINLMPIISKTACPTKKINKIRIDKHKIYIALFENYKFSPSLRWPRTLEFYLNSRIVRA